MTGSSKPRLALDTYVLAQGIKTGVYRVCDELFPRLMKSPRINGCLYFRDGTAQHELTLRQKMPVPLCNAAGEGPGGGADIVLSPFGVAPPEWLADRRVLRAHIIYDLIAIHHPEYFTEAGAAEVKRIMDSLERDMIVFAISECTKRDLLAYRPDLEPDRIVVIPLAAGDGFRPESEERAGISVREKYGIPANVPYLLSLATLEVRKNMDVMVRAFALHLESDPDSNLHLVLAGMSGWKLDGLRSALASVRRWRHRIILTGFVEDQDLSALYSQSLAFCYLSRYEGFGLPPLEAMACGVPVICADNSSLPEVVGNAGMLVDANDASGVAAAIEQLKSSPSLRQDLSRSGLLRAQAFSWERCTDLIIDTLVLEFERRASV